MFQTGSIRLRRKAREDGTRRVAATPSLFPTLSFSTCKCRRRRATILRPTQGDPSLQLPCFRQRAERLKARQGTCARGGRLHYQAVQHAAVPSGCATISRSTTSAAPSKSSSHAPEPHHRRHIIRRLSRAMESARASDPARTARQPLVKALATGGMERHGRHPVRGPCPLLRGQSRSDYICSNRSSDMSRPRDSQTPGIVAHIIVRTRIRCCDRPASCADASRALVREGYPKVSRAKGFHWRFPSRNRPTPTA